MADSLRLCRHCPYIIEHAVFLTMGKGLQSEDKGRNRSMRFQFVR